MSEHEKELLKQAEDLEAAGEDSARARRALEEEEEHESHARNQ